MDTGLILLLEDDYDQSAGIKRSIEDCGFSVMCLDSEHAFREWVVGSGKPPLAAVIDVCVRYGSMEGIGNGLPNPYQAGFRCSALLEQIHPGTPVVLYSHFSKDDSDYKGNLPYLKKRDQNRHLCSLLERLTSPKFSGQIGFVN